MTPGAFYWILYSKLVLAEDGRTSQPSEEIFGPEPARFTGDSGGSPPRPTWDFIGVASELEDRQVREVGPQLLTSWSSIYYKAGENGKS